MRQFKPEYIHGVNSLLTRVNLSLFSLRNKVDSPEDIKKIEHSIRDIKTLQRRIENAFGLFSYIENNIELLTVEKLTSYISAECKGIEVYVVNSECIYYQIQVDLKLLKLIIDEINLYYNLKSSELLNIKVLNDVDCDDLSILFKYRSDHLVQVTNKDLDDEQVIRKEKLLKWAESMGWELQISEVEVNIKCKILKKD